MLLFLSPTSVLCDLGLVLHCVLLLLRSSVFDRCFSQRLSCLSVSLNSHLLPATKKPGMILHSTQLNPAKFVASSSFLCIYYYLLSDDPKLLFCFCFPHIWSSLWFSEMGFFLICKKDLVLIFCVSASFWVLFSNALPFAKAHFFRDCSPDLYR